LVCLKEPTFYVDYNLLIISLSLSPLVKSIPYFNPEQCFVPLYFAFSMEIDHC
jgi:hypothetical protein